MKFSRMNFSLALPFAAFFIGISVPSAAVIEQMWGKKTYAKAAVENEDSMDESAEDVRDNSDDTSPELRSQIALIENMKVRTVAVNPANLISALLKTPEDQIISALPTLHQLTELLEETPLGAFLHNLEIVVSGSNPYLWHSVIESNPAFLGSIAEAGENLADLANTEADQLTIFNEKEIMGLSNIFPIADVFSKADSFLQHEQSEIETDGIVPIM